MDELSVEVGVVDLRVGTGDESSVEVGIVDRVVDLPVGTVSTTTGGEVE